MNSWGKSSLDLDLNILTGGEVPASEKPESKAAPVKEQPAVEVSEDQDRAVTDHQLGVCPPDRQVFHLGEQNPSMIQSFVC